MEALICDGIDLSGIGDGPVTLVIDNPAITSHSSRLSSALSEKNPTAQGNGLCIDSASAAAAATTLV
jgi:hypothetical protein